MKKKAIKKYSHRKRKSHSDSLVYIRYISFALVVFSVILIGKVLLSAQNRLHVLGTSIGPVMLAKGGDDSEGGSGGEDSSSHGGSSGGGSNSGSNSGSGSSNSGSDSTSVGTSNSEDNNSGSQSSISDSTQVDCVGPDGKHFTTDFKKCSEFNSQWNHSNFSFTPLSTPKPQQSVQQKKQTKKEIPETETEKPEPTGKNLEKLEVKTQNEKTRLKLNLNEQGMKVKIESEGNKFTITAKKPDGEEVELKEDDALKKVNDSLKEQEIELERNENNNLTITKNEVEAETELPISVDPVTHELTITTPSGTKTVAVLPDEAVENILDEKLLTNIESQVSTKSGTPTQRTVLTELNNEPTFEVKGISQKKILGFIPIGFSKTVFVSATTGEVVKTDEAFLNRLLETFSS